ncbi:MAG: hypothetical protein ACTSQY_05935 [Candidatus Odinarchaeia archaeon]
MINEIKMFSKNDLEKIWLLIKNRTPENKNSYINSIDTKTQESLIAILNNILDTDYEDITQFNFNDETNVSKIIIFLVKNGYVIEDMVTVLNWVEFEHLCMEIFKHHNFNCKIHYRFTVDKKRFEIDIIGYKNGILFAADAKKWSPRLGKKSALKQEHRITNLPKSNKIKDLKQWQIKTIFPLLITWYDENIRFYNRIPIVPMYCLNDFLNHFYELDLKSYQLKFD